MLFKKKNILRLAYFLLLLAPVVSVAQNLSNQKIEFDKTSQNVKQIVNTLDEYFEVSSPKNYTWDYSIELPSKTIELSKLFELLAFTTPYSFKLKDNELVITEKTLLSEYKISGKTIDKETGETLIGVNIYLKQDGKGTVSDQLGNYEMILAPGKYILIYSFVGCKKIEKTVYLFNDKAVYVSLEKEGQEIEEVQISASRQLFGDMEKGRSIETIDSKVIESLKLNNVSEALHGSVKGIWSTKMSGAPGDHQKLRIRGISSIFGATDPLYVVDGIPIPIVNLKSLGISDLNMHDIEKITILKSASSTALYGYHGSNGVILIDTKKGGGETQINFSTKLGYQRFDKRYNLFNTKEFLENLQQSDNIIGTDFYEVKIRGYAPKYEEYPYYTDSSGNVMGYTNWQDEIFKTGTINEYQLSAKGQVKQFNYYVSANIFNHNGVVLKSGYKKKTFTASVNRTFKELLNVGLQYRICNEENNNNLDSYGGNKIIFKGISTEPAYISTPDSFLRKRSRLYLFNYDRPYLYGETFMKLDNTEISPYDIASNRRNQESNIHTGNLFLKLNLPNNLSLNTNIGGSFRNMMYLTDEPEKHLQSNEGIILLHHQTNLSYSESFKKHNVQLTLGVRNYTDNTYWEVDTTSIDLFNYRVSDEDVFLRGSQAKYGPEGAAIRSINSLLGHFNYSFNNKYFVSLVANYDHLIDGDYLDVKSLFPSIALNWDISQEILLKKIKKLDFFNIYYNWGKSGNYSLNSLSGDLMNYDHYYFIEDNPVVYHHNLANHKIKHEEVNEHNYGIKLGLFNERIVLETDYFEKTNRNLILIRDIPIHFGSGYLNYNVGEMFNKGIELSLELIPIQSRSFYWKTKFGYTQNHQLITKLDGSEALKFYNSDILIPYFEAAVNEDLGVMLGYKYIGKWIDEENTEPNEEDPDSDEPVIYYVKDLGAKYQKFDTLSPKALVDADRTIIGKSIPDFTYFWMNTFQYKSFTLDFLWYASIGMDKYNATKASTYITGVNADVSGFVSDSLNYFRSGRFCESSYFVENASFIRLKYITLNYKHPKSFYNKVYLSLSLTLDNVITLTKYSGYDPESSIYTDNNFTDNALDIGGYPNPRGILFSIDLTF